MEYQFTKNTLTGGIRIKCSMGHEVVARWLEEELTADKEKINALLETVAELKTGLSGEVTLRGKEISAYLSSDDVIIQENVLSYDSDEESEFDFYDSESTSACGLEDFEELLKSFLEFLC
ncbi:YacL family protein [Vibrio sp. JC009]|uniref:YacL family protein n=1 Tax=Vibrio sp. JC009 TaxID=2912314 RepID=UPI0023B08DCB|nr:YacL family protein [Vibrio sp. JC009]WED22256.1 YacL family protein [Vibrio sp. JC009]